MASIRKPERHHGLAAMLCLAATILCLALSAVPLAADAQDRYPVDWQAVETESLEHFSALLRIDTSNPPGNETEAARYLQGVLQQGGIDSELFALDPTRANLVARLRGNGSKRPILVMAHTDVVGAQRENWSVDPFGAVVRDGYIYGRGSLDDKDNVTAGLMLMLLLERAGVELDRDVIFLAEAGEEGTTRFGIDYMVENHWDEIAAEYCLAEGGDTVMRDGEVWHVDIATTEKFPMRVRLVAHGTAGHGSIPRLDNAVWALARAVGRLGAWESPLRLNETTRAYFDRLGDISSPEQAARYKGVSDPAQQPEIERYFAENEPKHNSLLRTSVVPTMMSAGFRRNVIPTEAEAGMLQERRLGNVYQCFMARKAPLATSLALAITFWSCAPASTNDAIISGVVEGQDGPEAGVWVIAESDALGTGFIKIVVTDDDGRFVLPQLPDASYDVWVRGYGLADSEPVAAGPGDDLVLTAVYPETPQEEAAVYPASYWYSLLEVPDADEFPGTGPSGNGISPVVRSQAQWIDNLKQGCQLCHQLGNQITREIAHLDRRFSTTAEAWDRRVTFGQRGPRMSGALNGMGRERAIQQFADWTDRIAAGEVPPQPPRPQGEERNVVLTLWDWGDGTSYVHDEVASDKRDPSVNAGGDVYAVSMSDDRLLIVDPNTNEARDLRVPVRDPETQSYFPTTPGFEPSVFWGEEVILDGPANIHNPMMDQDGRVWLTSRIRNSPDNPEWCREGSSNAYAQYFPLNNSGRQASVFHPDTEAFTLVDTCFGTHHLQFGEDEENTLYFSGDTRVVGWVRTSPLLDGSPGPLVDPIRDQAPARLAVRAEEAQGWCPTVVDTNGDGRITRPWNRGSGPRDPNLDTQFTGFAYGVVVNPVDNSVWIARTGGVPGRIYRLELGDNPPETCSAEVYEPPFENPDVPEEDWGFSPRGIDITRDGIIWTALSGSGHLASFDRSKCTVLIGPEATGQHCPEGWTLYRAPGPRMKNAATSASADFHYYNWVDQFNTLGLGENIPIANGTTSDALLALNPDSGEWVRLRVPYPLGFYSRGLDGRIDDPDAGWKGRGVWADFGTNIPWHLEGGQGTTSKIVKFQIRPDPLAY